MYDTPTIPKVPTDRTTLSDEALTQMVLQLEALSDWVEAARLLVLGEWDHRALWAADGASDGVEWLVALGRRGSADLRSLLQDARQLRTMPATRAAMTGEPRESP